MSDAGKMVWELANSPLGVSIVLAVLSFAMARLFKARPEWEAIYNAHRGKFFDAVRAAEKAIPDTSESKAAKRSDAALNYMLKLEPGLLRKKTVVVRQAIDAAHKEIEEA